MNRFRLFLALAVGAMVLFSASYGWAKTMENEPAQPPQKTKPAKKSPKRVAVPIPPPPTNHPQELYDRGQLLKTSFPKYFSFVADSRGQGSEGGVIRVKVRREDPLTNENINTTYEVRNVGEIIASDERGAAIVRDGAEMSTVGKMLLTTGDDVMIQFTEDLAKIMDSDTYADNDPYFRDFPIYGISNPVRSANPSRADYGRTKGELLKYKGQVTVVSRVEGLAPITKGDSNRLKKKKGKNNQDIEPVSYVARITYSEDVIDLGDQVFIFIPQNPGAERRLDAPFVEPADTYNSLGN